MEKIKIKKETAFLFSGKKSVSKKLMIDTNTTGSTSTSIIIYP